MAFTRTRKVARKSYVLRWTAPAIVFLTVLIATAAVAQTAGPFPPLFLSAIA